MIARLAVVSLGLCGAFVVACGSSDKGDLFKGNSGGYAGTANASSGGTTTGGSSGDGGSVSGGSGGDVGGSGGAVTGGTAGAPLGGAGGSLGGAGGGTGGEPLGGAGGSLGGAGGNTGGTGGVVVTSSVSCDGQSCTIPGQFCCQNYDFSMNDWKGSCLPSGGGCTLGSNLSCDGPEDCNSFDDCCGTIGNIGGYDYYSSFKCVPKGQCDYTNDQRIICGQTPGACPGGTYCGNSTLLPGYKACVPQ